MDAPALQIVPRGPYYTVVASGRIVAQGSHELCQRVLNEGPRWMLVPLVCPICAQGFTLRHDQLMELAEGLRVSPDAVVPVCQPCQKEMGNG